MIKPSPPRVLPFVVRACVDQDMGHVQALYAHHVLTGTASFEEMPPSLDDMLTRRQAVIAQNCPYLVAEQEGMIVGFAYAGAFRTRSAYRFTVENTVYLAPSSLRLGIARALMEVVIAQCGAAGYRQMIAVIGDENPASVAFHAALGFRVVGRMDAVGFKFNRWLDTTLMQFALGAES